MERMQRVVKVIPSGQWPDSRAEQRDYWRSRPPAERVQAGRDLHRKMFWWMNGRELPRQMEKTVRIFRYGR